jgi:hypothetical protein
VIAAIDTPVHSTPGPALGWPDLAIVAVVIVIWWLGRQIVRRLR